MSPGKISRTVRFRLDKFLSLHRAHGLLIQGWNSCRSESNILVSTGESPGKPGLSLFNGMEVVLQPVSYLCIIMMITDF